MTRDNKRTIIDDGIFYMLSLIGKVGLSLNNGHLVKIILRPLGMTKRRLVDLHFSSLHSLCVGGVIMVSPYQS